MQLHRRADREVINPKKYYHKRKINQTISITDEKKLVIFDEYMKLATATLLSGYEFVFIDGTKMRAYIQLVNRTKPLSCNSISNKTNIENELFHNARYRMELSGPHADKYGYSIKLYPSFKQRFKEMIKTNNSELRHVSPTKAYIK
jgi:hypothetical protein